MSKIEGDNRMEKKILPELYPFRGPLLERMSHIAHYQHTRALHEQMVTELTKFKEDMGNPGKDSTGAFQFKNAREEMTFLHRQKTLQVLIKQEKHMNSKLTQLEKSIRRDMDTFDKEVTDNTQ